MRAPHLQVAPPGVLGQVRDRVARPPILGHELRQRDPRAHHRRRERAELALAFLLQIKRVRVALAIKQPRRVPPTLEPTNLVLPPLGIPFDAHDRTLRATTGHRPVASRSIRRRSSTLPGRGRDRCRPGRRASSGAAAATTTGRDSIQASASNSRTSSLCAGRNATSSPEAIARRTALCSHRARSATSGTVR